MATTETALSATAAALSGAGAGATLAASSSKAREGYGEYVATLERKGKKLEITSYRDETQIDDIIALMAVDLSEPYSIYTYRYFLNGWPKYCLLAHCEGRLIGGILCKAEQEKGQMRGYIAMFAVDAKHRNLGIGSTLASLALHRMAQVCDEIVLETEITNEAALRLYESLGFIREKRLPKYYMNGNDAYRLHCWLV